MEHVFDLHLYLANWGTRVFSMRLPRRLIDTAVVEACLIDDEIASMRVVGENTVIAIVCDELVFEDWDDGSGWLGALASLRSGILNGDLRLLYLVWLMAVDAGVVADNAIEPAIDLSPLSGAHEAFADFFAIDADLIDAAIVEDGAPKDEPGLAQAHALIQALPEREKAALLIELFDGNDPHLATGFRRRIRERLSRPRDESRRRTAGDLRWAARKISERRRRREEEQAVAERRRKELEKAKEEQRRLEALKRRGEAVWTDIEAAIVLRNAPGYDKAATLLADLRMVAEQLGKMATFRRRLEDICERHARKGRFLEKLASLGL